MPCMDLHGGQWMVCATDMEYCTTTKETWQLRRFGAPSTIEKSSSLIRLVPDGQVSVGRGPKADHFLDSHIYARLISRVHAVISGEMLPDGHVRFTLTNKGLNGTYINDFKLGIHEDNSQVLREGDKVAFGHINCGSIKAGEYAPQANSEFQFLVERVHTPLDQSPCHTEGTDPFFSPYPSETPVYSDTAGLPIDSLELDLDPPSPRSTDKENNTRLQSTRGVRSFDSEDASLEEKPSCLNVKVNSNTGLDNGDHEEWAHDNKLDPNFSPHHKTEDFDVFSIQQQECANNLSGKPSLPDVIPDSVKHDRSANHHRHTRRLGKELTRSHSLPAPRMHGDEDENSYSCATSQQRIKQETNNSRCSIEDNEVGDNRSLPHMSKKKKYILSMAKEGQNERQAAGKGGLHYHHKGVNNDLHTQHKGDNNSLLCHEQGKDEGNMLLEKNRNDKKLEKIDEEVCSSSTRPSLCKVGIKFENVEDGQVTPDPFPLAVLIPGKGLKDEPFCHRSGEGNTCLSPVLLLKKLPEDLKNVQCYGKEERDFFASRRKLKWDKKKSEELSENPPSVKQGSPSASPVVVMEKIPDNLEGKMWTHLKSKENFSTKKVKVSSSSPSKLKSSKKHRHHHHPHHLHHHRHHLDHNIQIKQQKSSSSSHLHNAIPPHPSSSSKSFKASHASHHSKHKKSRPPAQNAVVPTVPTATPDRNSDEVMPLKTKTKNKDNTVSPLKVNSTDKINCVTPVGKSEFSSSTSKATHSHKHLSRSSQIKKHHHSSSKVHHTPKDISPTSSSLSSSTSSSPTSSSSSSPSSPIKSSPTSALPQSLVKVSGGGDEGHSRGKTRLVSTGFLSSDLDLNSEDEETRSRENSPPNKKADIMKKIYSPSASPKPCDKLEVKATKSTHKGHSSTTVPEDVKQKCVSGSVEKAVSPCPDTERTQDRKSNNDSELSPETLDGKSPGLKKKKSKEEDDGKCQKNDSSAKRKHELSGKKEKNDLSTSSKTMTPQTSSSSIKAKHSTTPGSVPIKTNTPNPHKVTPSQPTTTSSHSAMSSTEPLFSPDTNSTPNKVTAKPSPTPSLSKSDKPKQNSTKRKYPQSSNDLDPSTKSNSNPKIIPDSSSPSKSAKPNPSCCKTTKTEQDKKSQNRLVSESRVTNNSSTLTIDPSQKQPEIKNTKNRTKRFPDRAPSSSTTTVSSQPLPKQTTTGEKKSNLKRPSDGDGGDSNSNTTVPTPAKLRREPSLSDLLRKRLRLKEMSSSSSSSSSLSPSDPPSSLLLLSEKLPANKSKNESVHHTADTTKAKESPSKRHPPTPKDKIPSPSSDSNAKKKLSSPRGKLTLETAKKPTTQESQQQRNSSNQTIKPSPKSSTKTPDTSVGLKQPKPAELKHQELFSSALNLPKPERPKEKKSSKVSDKSVPTPKPLLKKPLRKQEVVQELTVDSKLRKRVVVDHRGPRRSTRPGSLRPPHTKEDDNSSPLSKAGKKPVKKKSKWAATASDDNDDDANDEDFDVTAEEEEGEDWNLDEGVEYCNEPCEAKKCSNPVGPKVDWVMCDACEGWYHIVCVNTTLEQIAKDGDQFQCGFC